MPTICIFRPILVNLYYEDADVSQKVVSEIIKGFYCDVDDADDADDDEIKDEDADGKKGTKPSLAAMIEGFIWEPICPQLKQRRRAR